MKIFSRFFDVIKNEAGPFINDLRRMKRYALPLRLNYYDPVAKCERQSLTRNISRTGLRFPVAKRFPKGTVLDLKIEDPYGNTPITSKAKIIWSQEFITGDNAEDLVYEVGVRLLKKRLWN